MQRLEPVKFAASMRRLNESERLDTRRHLANGDSITMMPLPDESPKSFAGLDTLHTIQGIYEKNSLSNGLSFIAQTLSYLS